MKLTDKYRVPRFNNKNDIIVTVPGSKSITNRALILAALGGERCVLQGVLFSDDSRAVLECLTLLGFPIEIEESAKQVTITGCGGQLPNRQATLNVRSAGTAARFLTVLLAFAGGDYTLTSSQQMKKRPMEPLLSILREAGAEIICLEEPGHFPFRIKSSGLTITEVTVDTGISSQFASALLMAGVLLPTGLRVMLAGRRTDGAYIAITLRMMEQFGIPVERVGNCCIVPPFERSGNSSLLPAAEQAGDSRLASPLERSGNSGWLPTEMCTGNSGLLPTEKGFGRKEYVIEPDVSGACYFYAMAPLLGCDVMVKDVHRDSLQGDIRFLELLEKMGGILEDTAVGLWLRGRQITSFPGLDVDMGDFSDQAMTLAALAPFATSSTTIRNIGHIRFQESDRLSAIKTELNRIGIACELTTDGNGLYIEPGLVAGGTVETYEDHRMAMAFTLPGLKTGNITIQNPACCAKTFENYFTLINKLTSH